MLVKAKMKNCEIFLAKAPRECVSDHSLNLSARSDTLLTQRDFYEDLKHHWGHATR